MKIILNVVTLRQCFLAQEIFVLERAIPRERVPLRGKLTVFPVLILSETGDSASPFRPTFTVQYRISEAPMRNFDPINDLTSKFAASKFAYGTK